MGGVSLTNWTQADADRILAGGNAREHKELMAHWRISDQSVNRDSSDQDVRAFIRAEYVEKKWARSREGSSYGGGGNHLGTSLSDEESVRKLVAMFPELIESQAAQLLNEHGSIDAAAAHVSHKNEPDRERGRDGRNSSKSRGVSKSRRGTSRKSRKASRNSDSDGGSPNGNQNFSEQNFSQPLGTAGMLGMAAHGEISTFNAVRPNMQGAGIGGAYGGSFGSQAQLNHFGSMPGIPGQFPNPQQGQFTGMWSPPASSAGPYGCMQSPTTSVGQQADQFGSMQGQLGGMTGMQGLQSQQAFPVSPPYDQMPFGGIPGQQHSAIPGQQHSDAASSWQQAPAANNWQQEQMSMSIRPNSGSWNAGGQHQFQHQLSTGTMMPSSQPQGLGLQHPFDFHSSNGPGGGRVPATCDFPPNQSMYNGWGHHQHHQQQQRQQMQNQLQQQFQHMQQLQQQLEQLQQQQDQRRQQHQQQQLMRPPATQPSLGAPHAPLTSQWGPPPGTMQPDGFLGPPQSTQMMGALHGSNPFASFGQQPTPGFPVETR